MNTCRWHIQVAHASCKWHHRMRLSRERTRSASVESAYEAHGSVSALSALEIVL